MYTKYSVLLFDSYSWFGRTERPGYKMCTLYMPYKISVRRRSIVLTAAGYCTNNMGRCHRFMGDLARDSRLESLGLLHHVLMPSLLGEFSDTSIGCVPGINGRASKPKVNFESNHSRKSQRFSITAFELRRGFLRASHYRQTSPNRSSC
jgi:hypothetical protein